MDSKDNKYFYKMIDTLAHEYHWTIEYIQQLELPEVLGLLEEIMERQLREYEMQVIVVNRGMIGKPLTSVPESKTQRTEADQLKDLMRVLKSEVTEVKKK